MTTDLLGPTRGFAYLAASLLFILSLRGLSTQESARRGNLLGSLGMALAVVVTAVVLLVSRATSESAATAVRLAAEDAGRQAGVAFAEGFRSLHLGG